MNAYQQAIPAPLADRAYVGVYTYTDAQGMVRPTRIRWEDGREWDIDRVIDARPAAARKAGGAGIRYLVRIGQYQRELYFVDGRWFTEVNA